MEELYSETYLKAKPSPKRTAVRWGLIFLCLFLVVFDLMVLKSLYLLIFVFIVDAMIIYFLPKKNVAYEYVFVDGQIDFDLIINGERRKHKKKSRTGCTGGSTCFIQFKKSSYGGLFFENAWR